jgi:hypothetical protein
MTTAAATVTSIARWREPTETQWYAYVAAWAGWTLDAFAAAEICFAAPNFTAQLTGAAA